MLENQKSVHKTADLREQLIGNKIFEKVMKPNSVPKLNSKNIK